MVKISSLEEDKILHSPNSSKIISNSDVSEFKGHNALTSRNQLRPIH